jgi:hypothetical protein
MEILSNSQEYDIFNTDAIQNLIKFKWRNVGRNHHAFGALMHLLYLLYLCFYVNNVYITASYQNKLDVDKNALNTESLIFIIGVLYPFSYEFM